MRRIISLLIVAVLSWTLFDDLIFAQRSNGVAQEEPQTKVIDLTADIVYPITLSDGAEVMCLVGNFAAQHNGAIIIADSAVRYNDKRLECFGKVLINKNTTYAYADRADYNGDLNEVQLYAPIIKVIDGDATMYCYNFKFNTSSNIGSYDGGGVMIKGENVMESITGYYYSDTKELIGVGDVELKGDEYQMTSDSMIYNTETDAAQYFTNTNIWNKKNEYLYADLGDYNKAQDRYSFTENGYILTEEQEMWSDSLDYFRASEHIFMRSNVQIDDTTQKSLIFGDYGEYVKNPGDMVLVGRPSLINYDLEQGDSLFMRADTFQIFTLNRFDGVDSTTFVSATEMAKEILSEDDNHDHSAEEHNYDHDGHNHEGHDHDDHAHDAVESVVPNVSPRVNVGSQAVDSVAQSATPLKDSLTVQGADSVAVDSLSVDSVKLDSIARAADTLNFWQRKKAQFLAARKERAKQKLIEDAARKVVLDSIGRERQKVINAKLDAEKVRDARRVAERKLKIAARKAKKLRRDVAKGKISPEDTVAMMSDLTIDTAALISELANIDTLKTDSVSLDSMLVDSLSLDSLAADSLAVDSTYRLTKGYRNVKIYRSDFQAVADSMATNSLDSVIRLYIDPVLWHDNNQVTSDVMDIYSENNTIKKAIFSGGTPIMASEVETEKYYNQIAGKVITSLFENGELYRTDADGNAQTIYFMQDEDTQDVTGMMVMASGSATFYIEDQTVVGITYRGEPTYTLYPMSKIPADQEMNLKGFKWQATDRRPTQAEVFDRTIRPSVREAKSAIPKPQFPLYEALKAQRIELIKSRLWLDRRDLVPPQAEEWMESLGYKTGQPR